MKTSAEIPIQTVALPRAKAAAPEPEDFCLADQMALMSDAQLEQMAEEDAQNDVSSSAYEGIPLDKAALKAELIESYKKLRAEWPTRPRERQAEIEWVSRRG